MGSPMPDVGLRHVAAGTGAGGERMVIPYPSVFRVLKMGAVRPAVDRERCVFSGLQRFCRHVLLPR